MRGLPILGLTRTGSELVLVFDGLEFGLGQRIAKRCLHHGDSHRPTMVWNLVCTVDFCGMTVFLFSENHVSAAASTNHFADPIQALLSQSTE